MITRKLLLALLGGLIAMMFVFIACSEDRTSTSYEVHPTGWMTPGDARFHGLAAIPGGGESCLACHAALQSDYVLSSADEDAIGCYVCHGSQYPHLWDSPVPSHRVIIQNSNYDLEGCASCHGANFTGGNTGVSCLSCHTTPAGVADCNLCHGQPPVDNGGLPTGYIDGAYGVHAAHSRYACTECHNPPNGIEHIDGVPADIDFSWAEISTLNGRVPVSPPPADPASGNRGCSNVYCHGDATVNWLQPGSVSCGSCHSIPPATDIHMQGENRCHICHWGVSPESNYDLPDGAGIFFLPEHEAEHVNGVADVQLFDL